MWITFLNNQTAKPNEDLIHDDEGERKKLFGFW